MRILFISPYIPSLIRVRPYNLIKHLAKRGHQITLLALVPPGEDTGSLETLQGWCERIETVPLPRWRTLWNGLKALPSQTPLQAAYSRSPEMAAAICSIQAKGAFDVVHIEHLRGSELSGALENLPVVFDSVDSITLLFEKVLQSGPNWKSRLIARVELGRTRRYEGHLLERYERVLVTSPQDRDALARYANTPEPNERLVVLPNGVDLDYFTPLNMEREPATVIFTGKMSYHANIAAAMDLATAVMPRVWQQLPEARLVIAGKDPPPALQELAEDSRITVTGMVPDLRPYLAQATVAVLPIRYGVGIQNKILEAMAMATPVVTTSHTLSALQVKADEELVVADGPAALGEVTVKLLNDQALSQRVGDAGRRYVETHHDWNNVARKLEGVYQSAAVYAS
jgi:sugar transferase (PEP-CTERM/EpsH1 system associated)